MFRMFIAPVVAVAVFALMGTSAQASDEAHGHKDHANHQAQSDDAKRLGDPYPLKVDPLGDSLVDVDKPIVIVHESRELRFASEENLKKFKADPDKYLAAVDKKIIAQQKPTYPLATCVVSGQKLGNMGEPVDVVIGNRLVRFCCGGCKNALMKDPAKYFTKIDAAVIKAQADDYPMDTCVVSGEGLDEMGKPVDYVIGTRLVRFCCKGCVKMFEKNPAKYLAKIDAHHGDDADAGDHQDDGDGNEHQGHNH